MADLHRYLAILDGDPDDSTAFAALAGVAGADDAAGAFAKAKQVHRERGRFDVVVRLIDVELAAATDPGRRADLMLEKGLVSEDDLLDEASASQCFQAVLALRPGDPAATEALDQIQIERDNWQKFATKYRDEARTSTDRQLGSSLLLSAAETVARHQPDDPLVEEYLTAALEIDVHNTKAALHLERLLRRAGRWDELGRLIRRRADTAGTREERVANLIGLAEALRQGGDANHAREALVKALAIDPGHPVAVRQLSDGYAANEQWDELAALYQGALRARRGDGEDVGLLLQVGMIQWKRLGQLDQAEEWFRRIRKVDPGHAAALDFYRAYYPPRGETAKLLQMLRQAEKQLGAGGGKAADARSRSLALEMAELAEGQLGNQERAIEAWKQLLRTDSSSTEARGALRRLYRKGEKWNALLDLMKDEIEHLPASDVAGRVEQMFELVDIYRDRLRLDGMVINTYNAILKLDPDNKRAIDELADRYRVMARWNDLIATLTRKAELASVSAGARVAILREIGDLWIERFGNFAQAIRPLERLLELAPGDADALVKLKDIYTRRRQWRALISLLATEAAADPDLGTRRIKQAEMARLATDRVGDQRLAIEIWNQVLAEAEPGDDLAEAWSALVALYEREKRWVALAEALRRHRELVHTPQDAVAVLERLGAVFADRLGAPAQAAAIWQEILALDPRHGKALRTLRELLAQAQDWQGLEKLYEQLGQEAELVDALVVIADRSDDRKTRVAIMERAALLAQRRARASQRTDAADREIRVWERLLAVEPHHAGAARELAPVYRKQEKWARLLPVLEIMLADAGDDPAARLEVVAEVRALVETRLGSKALAFTWAVRQFELAPGDETVRGDLLRLAQDKDQIAELVGLFDRHAAEDRLPASARVALLRELGRLATSRLGDAERARAYWAQVAQLAPDDPEAAAQLEDLAAQVSDWPALLASLRRRLERTDDAEARARQLIEIAQLEEAKLADLDLAAASYQQALATAPEGEAVRLVAVRALARLHEARGDWDGLIGALRAELAAATDPTRRRALLMRIGGLLENSLVRPEAALADYLEAFSIADRDGPPPDVVDALARYIDSTQVPSARRVEVAALLRPTLEQRGDALGLARALEVLRAGSDGAVATRVDLDRRLLALYIERLADPARAWDVALRLHAEEPADFGVRRALIELSGALGRDGEMLGHLVAGLDKLRAAAAPPAEIRELAVEAARFAGGRLGDRPAEERAWRIVLEVDPAAADAFDALAMRYRADARWPELRELLDKRAAISLDADGRKVALVELARLDEEALVDPARAIASHRRILELDPGYLPSYQAIGRLLDDAGAWGELDDLLARQLDHDDRGAVGLRFRRAQLKVAHLGDPSGAVDLLEDVVARQRGHADARELLEEVLGTTPDGGSTVSAVDPALQLRVARVLEPLYQADKLWKDLVLTLRIQSAAAAGPAEAVELMARIAELQETQLASADGVDYAGAGPRAAFETWLSALAVDPTDDRIRTAIPRLAQALDRWQDAAHAWEAAAAATSDPRVKAGLYADLGEFYDIHLGDGDRAIVAYQRLLAADPNDPETNRRAGGALSRLFEEEERWGELRDVLRRQANWTDSPDDRRSLLCRVAALEEGRLGDRGAAIMAWREVLGEDPDDVTALEALDRLYTADGRWSELIEIARRRVERAGHPVTKKRELRRIAEIHAKRLNNPSDAIGAHLEILDHVPDDEETLLELSRLYREHGRHADLLDILERRLAAGAGATTEIQIEIATLLDEPLGRPTEALERWAGVLTVDPSSLRALAAVRNAFDEPGLRLRAAAILGPLYEATGQHADRAVMLEKLAESDDEPRERLRRLREVAALREHRLGDKDGALGAALRALAGAAGEPELPELVAEAERLAGDLGREGDLIEVYRQIAPDVLDADLQRRLYLDVADLARGVRNDLELARENYQKVLDGQPDDRRALLALESLAREAGDHRKLYELMIRKADLAGGDVDERVEALGEAATIAGSILGKPDDAIVAWLAVLDLAPERPDAVVALDALYREQARWHDLVDLYERRLGFAATIEEAVALRVAMAELHANRLYDLEGALENYSAALGGDPDHPVALAALERFLDEPQVRAGAADVLEPHYVAVQDWNKLVRIYEVKLDASDDAEDRLRTTRFVARLYEEQLEDFPGAMKWYARIFRELPADYQTRDQLARLAAVSDGWGFLAATYQDYLDAEPGEPDEVRHISLALAQIYERRLGDLDRAHAAYRRALTSGLDQATEDDREILRRLEGVLIRAGRWQTLAEIYDHVLAGGANDQVRRELSAKKARLYERELADHGRAVEAWRDVIDLAEDDPRARPALLEAETELERLYRGAASWHDLAELLTARLERTPAEDVMGRIDVRLRLAAVRDGELGDTPSAIEQYEEILATPTGWERALPHLERLVMSDAHRERIADLLEPIYRQHDWWQKLVVILDAKLQYVDDPARKVEMLREIARIHETRGGDPDLALAALARGWREDVGDPELLDELTLLAGKLGAWDELVGILADGQRSTLDPEAIAGIGTRIAEIHEVQRGDHDAAITAWRVVLEARADDLVALASLDRMLALGGRTDELVEVVERRAELADDAGVRLVLLHRVAALYEEVLERAPESIAAYKNVLAVDDTDLAALDGLERLYAAVGEHRELADVLRRKIELTTDIPERRQLRLALARVAADHLRDPYEAIAQLEATIADHPRDAEALIALEQIHERERMWPEMLDVLDRRALIEADAGARAELAFRAARLVERELADPDAAIPRYGAALQISSRHDGARAALIELSSRDDLVEAATLVLERLYRTDHDADGLVRVHERRLQLTGLDPALRREQWISLAEIHETLRQDDSAAFETWARAFAEDSSDLELLGPLERLAHGGKRWAELSALIDRELRDAPGADVEYQLAMKLGSLAEDVLADLERAAAAYERAAGTRVDERAALTALERVFAKASRWPEHGRVLARQADSAADDTAAAEYLFRLGDLRESTLRDPQGAVEAYRDALVRAPGHASTRAAFERLLRGGLDELDAGRAAPPALVEIVDVLEPQYEQDGDWARLADVLATRIHLAQSPIDRAALAQRLVELADKRLGDRDRAFAAAVGWLENDPGSDEALAEAERLADARRSHDVFARELARISAAVTDTEDRNALVLHLGVVQLDKIGDPAAAAQTFARLLATDPDHLGAVEAAARAARQQGDTANLAKLEWRRGELALERPVKTAAFAEAAALYEDLGDLDAATRGWDAVLEVDDTDRNALDRLIKLHERRGDQVALVETLGRAAEQARDTTDEKALLIRIAQLQAGDPVAAVRAWQAVLGVAPDDGAVIAELEAAHTRAGDWIAVQEILGRKLDLARGSQAKIAILADMARLAEERRGVPDDAIAHWYAVLDEDPSALVAYDHLERLLGASARWHDVVELLEKRAELEATLGHGEDEIHVLARAADVWEQRLDDPDAAGEILEKILRREPGSVAALTRLSRIYERNDEWDKCTRVLEQALGLGPHGTDAADLFFRLGEVARRGAGDPDTALAHLREALGHDAAHAPTIAALEALARDKNDVALLADMLRRRLSRATGADRRGALLELAELERKAGRPDAAIPLIVEAATASPDDAAVMGQLADLYVAAGRHDEAAPIFAKLADEARAARRMKDVARYRQRQGAILEARGDGAAALAAYEEAFRVNPTDIPTMAGLGRLYMQGKDWEKARRVYRSLVLQNIDVDTGVSKGDVYYALGVIHVEMGEAPKARGMFQRGLEIEPQHSRLKQALAELG